MAEWYLLQHAVKDSDGTPIPQKIFLIYFEFTQKTRSGAFWVKERQIVITTTITKCSIKTACHVWVKAEAQHFSSWFPYFEYRRGIPKYIHSRNELINLDLSGTSSNKPAFIVLIFINVLSKIYSINKYDIFGPKSNRRCMIMTTDN